MKNLPNIGTELERQLHEVGVNSLDDLESLGSREAWLKIQSIDSSACINRLMALEGAIQGVRWHDLPDEDKAKLKDFYESHKISEEQNDK